MGALVGLVDILDDPTHPVWPPRLQRLAIVHEDPAKIALGAELQARYPTDWSADVGMAGVLRSRAPLFVPQVTDAMVVEFKQMVSDLRIPIDETMWQKDLDFIKAMIHKEIDVDLFGEAEAFKGLTRRDPQLRFAVGLFPEAQSLLDLRKQRSTRAAR